MQAIKKISVQCGIFIFVATMNKTKTCPANYKESPFANENVTILTRRWINSTPCRWRVSFKPNVAQESKRHLHPDTCFVYFKQFTHQLAEIDAPISHKIKCKLAMIPIIQHIKRKKTPYTN